MHEGDLVFANIITNYRFPMIYCIAIDKLIVTLKIKLRKHFQPQPVGLDGISTPLQNWAPIPE